MVVNFIYRFYYAFIKFRKADSFIFGHPIFQDTEGSWRYLNDGSLFNFDRPKPCPKCHKERLENGHDPCIANLPNVKNACCGHGLVGKDYVSTTENRRMSLKNYLKSRKQK